MTESMVERELKFDLEPGYEPPEVSALVPTGGSTIDGHERLRSEYFDTAELALQRAHLTLRRRTGTSDTGWQLKVPHDPFRQEIRVDAEAGDVTAEVPSALTELLVGVCAGQPLHHTATLTTERATRRILDADGTMLVEIDDDTVSAEVVGGGEQATTGWREVEVELGAGSADLLDAVGGLVIDAGARPSDSPSKVTRALSMRPTASAQRPAAGTAAAVLLPYLEQQWRIILAGDIALRRGDETVIHKTRVATRRFRSTVRTFERLFDVQADPTIDEELRWFAGLMGQIRDLQVLESRLDSLVSELDPTLVLGPVRARIRDELGRERSEHWSHLETAMREERYLRLMTALTWWVDETPWAPLADEPAAVLRKPFKRARHTVAKRLRRGNDSGEAQDLHRARKAAKRARYAAEAVAPVIGDSPSEDIASRYEALQDLLGEHQDSIVSAELVRRLGIIAGTTKGENGFTFGVLREREERTARRTWKQARREAAKYG